MADHNDTLAVTQGQRVCLRHLAEVGDIDESELFSERAVSSHDVLITLDALRRLRDAKLARRVTGGRWRITALGCQMLDGIDVLHALSTERDELDERDAARRMMSRLGGLGWYRRISTERDELDERDELERRLGEAVRAAEQAGVDA